MNKDKKRSIAESNNNIVTQWLQHISKHDAEAVILISVKPNGGVLVNTSIATSDNVVEILSSIIKSKDNYKKETLTVSKKD